MYDPLLHVMETETKDNKPPSLVPLYAAVFAPIGALLGASITVFYNLYSDKRKRHIETKKLIAKYRDPLLGAAQDLQSTLYGIVTMDWASSGQVDFVSQYTCFAVGQYLAWVYIYRRQAQLLRFVHVDDKSSSWSATMNMIDIIFSDSIFSSSSTPTLFRLWHGQRLAIGEIMTVKEDGELLCMCYSAFSQKWPRGHGMKWFQSLEADIKNMALEVNRPDGRLRQLQHLLLQLIDNLDPNNLRCYKPDAELPCERDPLCPCFKCNECKNKTPQAYLNDQDEGSPPTIVASDTYEDVN